MHSHALPVASRPALPVRSVAPVRRETSPTVVISEIDAEEAANWDAEMARRGF